MGRDYYGGFPPYVSVAKRRAQAAKEVARRKKNGEKIFPVVVDGRTIASSFWGKSWCANLEGYSDFENRLPRGRSYVRNGSVVHLTVAKGRIDALVSGSELYTVQIEIAALPKPDWVRLKSELADKVGTLIELLQGKLSKAVMEMVTRRETGLFPKPKEIKMRCSCPDYAGMCKHVAAVMYGVGNRLDSAPELLFLLRGVDHRELIEQAVPDAPIPGRKGGPSIALDDLGAIFDIEIGDAPLPEPAIKSPRKSSPQPAPVKASRAKPTATSKTEAAARTTKKKPIADPAVKPTRAPKKAASKPVAAKIPLKASAKATASTAKASASSKKPKPAVVRKTKATSASKKVSS